ncbi:hypothetical protein NL359_29925, partial [Klebsiella pneumoniae]|nr:hypothetical protein [Bifidobacterium breve]MCP5749331.1 hypothetical protein [Klebsiella pneumoniae]
ESGEERREKSEKAIGENAENSRSDQSEACGEEKSGRVIITLFKQKRVRLLTKCALFMPDAA